jgi:hypothetical protein
MEKYAGYLAILRQLASALEELTVLAREKLAAVRHDDLDGLNQTMKREQALSLTVRSLEVKRRADLDALDLTDVPLRDLVAQYPEDMRAEAKETVEELQRQYQVYKGVSEAARAALECGLHEIEKALGEDGAVSVGVELPAQMRTDIHA